MLTAKEKYIAFIRNKFVPIYYRNKYLDAVCDGEWNVVLYEEKGQITAAYIYMIKRKFIIHYILQPKLCPYTGPVYFNPSDVQNAYAYLLANLPKHQLLIQDYFHNIPRVAVNKGIALKKHTYIIDKSAEIEELWSMHSSAHRRVIRQAEKELKYEIEENVTVFLDFAFKTFKKRGKRVPLFPLVFTKLDKLLLKDGLRKIVKCTNKENVVVAMCYFVKDEQWTYNFANCAVDDYSHYGINLILWNEIKLALTEGRSFDFEGSMIPGIDQFYKRFKGTKTYYQSIYSSSSLLIDLLVRIKTSIAGQ